MVMEERLTTVEGTVAHQDACITLLTSIAERQQDLLERIDANLEQVQHDTEMTRRLWVHLARKHGWLEDEDWPPPQ